MPHRIAVLTVIVLLCNPSAAWSEPWLFVSLLREKTIVAFERDAESGQLIRRSVTLCPAEPAFLQASPNGETLFVSFRSTGQLASYRIKADTGQLTLLSVVEGGEDPAYLQTDSSGEFLLTAYYAANKVTVHRIQSGGRISEKPIQAVSTAARAHGIAITADNATVLVPHTGANRIYSFRFDTQTGRLTAATPPFLTTPENHEPRHLVLHPTDRWAYTSNEKGDSISMFSLQNGQLSLQQTESTIPAKFDGATNATARCEITPDGRFVYVANRGHHSIAAFSINQSSGRVTSLGQTATEKTPRSFTIDPSGQYLYVAGQDTGRIAAYQIQLDGRLQKIASYNSGPVSWAVLAVDCNTLR